VLVSSYITQKARKGVASGIEGRGLAALAPIGAGEIVAIKGGHVVTAAALQSLPGGDMRSSARRAASLLQRRRLPGLLRGSLIPHAVN
jgi:hypothetical protein